MKMIILALRFLLCLAIFPLSASLNLEKSAQDFILETKRIFIPKYATAFNPSIVRWKGELWMSFRFFPNQRDIWIAHMAIVKLNESFEPIGEPYVLNVLDHSQSIPHSLEDARLIASGDSLYIVYNDHHEPDERWLRRICCAELDFDGKKFTCKNFEIFLDFEGVRRDRQEKNWTPFDYKGKLLFSYSLQPHRIIHSLLGENKCETLCSSRGDIRWKWGEVRGGTPALLINNEYFAFFHSMRKMKTEHSKNKSILHYFMGAYTFNSEPPFAVTRISKEPIVAKGFYKPLNFNYWGPRRVVYPCGYVADENFIWVSYGREDRQIWIAKIDKQMLLNSLVPVSDIPFYEPKP